MRLVFVAAANILENLVSDAGNGGGGIRAIKHGSFANTRSLLWEHSPPNGGMRKPERDDGE